MDPTSLLNFILSAGPSAGIGFSAGLGVLIAGLVLKKLVTAGQYDDMKARCDDIQKRLDKAEAEHKLTETELRTELRDKSDSLDDMRLLVAAGVATSRRNAHLASSLMVKALQPGEQHE